MRLIGDVENQTQFEKELNKKQNEKVEIKMKKFFNYLNEKSLEIVLGIFFFGFMAIPTFLVWLDLVIKSFTK